MIFLCRSGNRSIGAAEAATEAGIAPSYNVLDGFEEIKICTGYKLGDRVLDYLPAGLKDQEAVEPIYESLDGWKKSTRGARSSRDLPAASRPNPGSCGRLRA